MEITPTGWMTCHNGELTTGSIKATTTISKGVVHLTIRKHSLSRLCNTKTLPKLTRDLIPTIIEPE